MWVGHRDADLSEVPVKLGLRARRLWRKGDPRTAPSGRVQGGTYKNSYCGIRFGESKQADLPTGLKSALAALKPHAAYLHDLWRVGVKLNFFVGWFSDANSRDVLDWEILREMAELHISLDLDFYGPDGAAAEDVAE